MIVLLLCATMPAAGCSLLNRPEKVKVDHVVSTSGMTTASLDGPAEGVFQVSWQAGTGVSGEAREADFSVEGGRVIMVSKAGVVAFDAGTGRKAWHYREPGRKVEKFAVTGGAVVVGTSIDGAGSRLAGLDSTTGRLLWEAEPDWYDSTGSLVLGQRIPAGGGVVVARESRDSDAEFIGIDARTGEKRWSMAPEIGEDCETDLLIHRARNTDGSLVLIMENCPDAVTRFHGLDPATGHVRWVHQRRRDDLGVNIADGIAAFTENDPHEVTFLGRDGHPLPSSTELGKCRQCQMAVVGDEVVWPYQDERQLARIAFINIRTGGIRTMAANRPYLTVASDGHRSYGILPNLMTDVPVGELGVPTVWIDVLDPASDPPRPLPVPAALGDDRGVHWAATAGGRLILAVGPTSLSTEKGEITLAAYESMPSPGPLEFGGVPVDERPDCLKLLTAVPGERTEFRPDWRSNENPAVLGSARLPRRLCRGSLGPAGNVTVEVLWVTRRPQEADALLDGTAGQAPGPDEFASPDSAPETQVIRVGRVIVRVSAGGQNGLRVAVKAIAKKLRSAG